MYMHLDACTHILNLGFHISLDPNSFFRFNSLTRYVYYICLQGRGRVEILWWTQEEKPLDSTKRRILSHLMLNFFHYTQLYV
jgi:hypothetical protein